MIKIKKITTHLKQKQKILQFYKNKIDFITFSPKSMELYNIIYYYTTYTYSFIFYIFDEFVICIKNKPGPRFVW